eukprot:6502764-Alexandrium_andersonii.AAC.1
MDVALHGVVLRGALLEALVADGVALHGVDVRVSPRGAAPHGVLNGAPLVDGAIALHGVDLD